MTTQHCMKHTGGFVYLHRHRYKYVLTREFAARVRRLPVVCEGPSYLDCVCEYDEVRAMAASFCGTDRDIDDFLYEVAQDDAFTELL